MKKLYVSTLTAALLLSACGASPETAITDSSDTLCVQGICYASNAAAFMRNLPRGTQHELNQDGDTSYGELSSPVRLANIDFKVSYVQFDASPSRKNAVNIALFMAENVTPGIGDCEDAMTNVTSALRTQGLEFSQGPHRHSFLALNEGIFADGVLTTDVISLGQAPSSVTRSIVTFDDGSSRIFVTTTKRAANNAALHVEMMEADNQCDVFMTISTRENYGAYDLLAEF